MLTSDRIFLREFPFEDAFQIETFASDIEVAKSTLTIPHPYPKESAKEFIRFALDASKRGNLFIYAIVEKTTNLLIGVINLKIYPPYNRGELGYWIGKKYWGHGYGTETAICLLQYGFEVINLHKIFAQAFSSNVGSYRIMQKIGLQYEGTLKEHVCRDGIYHDLEVYGLLQKDFRKRVVSSQ